MTARPLTYGEVLSGAIPPERRAIRPREAEAAAASFIFSEPGRLRNGQRLAGLLLLDDIGLDSPVARLP
jgi:hypothetical protein